MSALNFEALLTTRDFENGMQRIRNDIKGTSNLAVQEAAKMDAAFKSLSLGIASYFSAQSLMGFVKELINVRGEFQKTEIAFTTMLGDGAKAKQLMGQMVDLTAKTPFSLQEVSSGAKQLLAFQVPANEVVDTLTRMGNIAAGLGVPLSRINLVYGQVKAKGKLMGDDLRQFTEAGIPMVAELANKFNKTEYEITAMVSAGKIGFKDVQDVLFNLTNEGGMFFNLMEQQSASLSGKISNLEDAWDQMLNKIGEGNQGILSDTIDELAWMVEHYEKVIEAIKVLVLMYGTYRAALIVQAAALEVAIAREQGLTIAQILRTSATQAADKATQALNATMFANPYAVAAALIVGLAAALTKMSLQLSYAEEAQAKLNKRLTEAKSNTEEQRAKIESLIVAIKSENLTNEKREVLLKQIKKLADGRLDQLTVEKIRTGEATEAINEYVKALDRQAKAKAYVDLKAENYKRIAEIDSRNGHTIGEAVSAVFDKNSWVDKNGKITSASLWRGFSQDFESQIKENEQREKNALIDQNKALDKQINDNADVLADAYSKGSGKVQGAMVGYVEGIEAKIDELQEAYKKARTPAEAARFLREIDMWQKKLDALKPQKESNKQIAEILPVGSIAELQRRAKLIEDAANVAVNGIVKLRKVDKYGAEKDKKGNVYYTGETVTVEEAKKRVEAINRAIREKQAESQARTFSEEMDEIKRQIGIRDKLLQQGYTKESIDKMFPKIKDKSFLQYLEETDIAVKKLIESGEADKETVQNLDLIKNSLKEYKGLETYIEGVNNQIDVLKTKFSGSELISQLDKFKKLNAGDSTEDERASRDKAVKKAQDDERKRIETNYNQLLNDHKTFEEKKAKITRDLNDALSLTKNESEKEKIRKAYNEQFSAITVEAFRNSKDWETAFGEMEFASKSTLERILKQLINFRQANKDNLSVQDYKIVSDKITEIQNRLYQFDPLKGLVSSYKNYRSDAEKLLKFLSDLEQANVDLADSYDLLNKAQSSEEFEAAMRKHDAALEKRRRATEGVKLAEDQFSNSQKKLISDINSTADKLKYAQEIIGSLKGIFDDLGISMDNAFGDVVSKVEQTLQGLEQVAGGLTKALSGIASGNIFQAVAGGIQAIGGLIKSISGWFNNDKKKERQIKSWAREVENLKNVYAELEYTVKKALGENVYKGQLDEIKNLEQQKALLSQMAQKEGDKKKKDQGKIDEYNAKMAEIDRTISDIRDNIIKTVLQTDPKDLASQLGDALVEAFSKGEDAAKSLDKAAGDVFRNMVKNALKMRMEESLKGVLDQILKASGFDKDGKGSFKGFTPEQIEQYKKQIAQIGASQEEFLKAYQQLFQDANANVSGMEGSIKSITSEEAGALIAQINAMRINQGKTINIHQDNLELMRGVLMQLMKIENNTRPIKGIYKEISELNSKVTNNNSFRGSGLD
ncbi:tape measure protein [Elizabethkingia anophelis]|uniref:tape measure protein n=1 Tax=Elizabethkingia anophelis TaxID=1117645 RepID=UPI000DDC0EA6|nr:tape measure protein [Elizabethkingia anophelis]RBA36159.1 hypothetical protein DSC50_02085 [Elizabethkingia anophelis]